MLFFAKSKTFGFQKSLFKLFQVLFLHAAFGLWAVLLDCVWDESCQSHAEVVVSLVHFI